MIIVVKPKTSKEEIDTLVAKLEEKGLKPVPFEGAERTVINVHGDTSPESIRTWQSYQCVENVVRIQKPWRLASREHHGQKSIVKVGNVTFGNDDCVMIAGPCSVESEEQMMEAAQHLKAMGVKVMRASAYKPRTSPYDFQGLGTEGLKILDKVRKETGLLVETEVMDVRDVKLASEHVDILRVGARNMQNYDLLKELGKLRGTPVILKRGMSATIKEFLLAAEYILAQGNKDVILCERGIRTFETAYRNTLDLCAVTVLKRDTHLPIIVDPSHAGGKRDLIPPLCKASVACGVDGLLVEMHPNPEEAWSDGAQSLYPEQLQELMEDLKKIAQAIGRKMA